MFGTSLSTPRQACAASDSSCETLLSASNRKHLRVRAGRRAIHIPGMHEELAGAPEQLDASALLLLLEQCDDGVQPGIGLAQGRGVRRDIAVISPSTGAPQP